MGKLCTEMCDHCWLTATKDHGICNLAMEQAPIGQECPYLVVRPRTCADCGRFNLDLACYTARPQDPADYCCGFYDKRESELKRWYYDILRRGGNPREEIMECIIDLEDSDVTAYIKENQCCDNTKWMEENYHLFDRINLMSAEEVRAILRKAEEL